MALFLEKTAVEWHPNASLMGAVTHWPELIRDGNWRCDWNADTVLVLCQVGTAPTEKWYRKGLEAATRSCRAAHSLCAGIVLASLLCCIRVQKWDEAFIAKQPWKWYALSIYKPTCLGPLSDCHQSSSHSSGSFATILTQKCCFFFSFLFLMGRPAELISCHAHFLLKPLWTLQRFHVEGVCLDWRRCFQHFPSSH